MTEGIAALVTTLGVPVVVVIMLLRELRPLLKNGCNGKAPELPTRADIRDQIHQQQRDQRDRDEIAFRKMDEQAALLNKINATQLVMVEKLENLRRS